MHHRIVVGCALALALLGSAVLATGPQLVYLPLVEKPLPSPTLLPDATPTATSPAPTIVPSPTPTLTPALTPTQGSVNVPQPTGVCSQNAPVPAEGAQAWMTVYAPARRSDTTLCVRLIVNGLAVNGATASGIAHYKTTNTDLGPAITSDNGTAAMTFNIGGATSGYMVPVDATVNGQNATTSFTPQ